MSTPSRWLPVTVAGWTAGASLVALAGLAATAAGPPNDNAYARDQFVIGLTSVGLGCYLAARRSRHPIGWLLLLAGTATWATFAAAPGIAWLFERVPEQERLIRWLLHLSVAGWIVGRGVFICLVPQAFPSGFGRSRGAQVLLGASVVSIAVTAVAHSLVWTPERFMGEPATGFAASAEDLLPWGHRGMLACAGASIAALAVRTYRSDAETRRRHQWFVAVIVVTLVPLLVDTYQEFVHSLSLDLSHVETWGMAILPVVLAVGILRHGLFDLRIVVRRTTLYATVSVVALGIYGSAIWVVTTLSDDGSGAAPLLAAGVVAVSLSHVRDGVQRATARVLFGTRDDPYATLAALGARVEAAPVGEQALQTVTDTICSQLRLPHAAIDLSLDGSEVRVAETGARQEHDEPFALSHRGIALGRLVVALRSPSEPFTTHERRLLADLARQTGVLAYNASLTEALRRSRVGLLNAREEERRRIRADLHDGLGPTLASVALGLGAAAERLPGEPELTRLLEDLEQELQTAIADVRALVYDLRPAALDDLGLVPALRAHAEMLARRTADTSRPLRVEIDASLGTGALPAAVEVAAYRVALEALTNVARHARASNCRIRLDASRGLALSVEDDGVGLPAEERLGVGLASMRERVEELGGRFVVGPCVPSGTAISAWFPLAVGAA